MRLTVEEYLTSMSEANYQSLIAAAKAIGLLTVMTHDVESDHLRKMCEDVLSEWAQSRANVRALQAEHDAAIAVANAAAIGGAK